MPFIVYYWYYYIIFTSPAKRVIRNLIISRCTCIYIVVFFFALFTNEKVYEKKKDWINDDTTQNEYRRDWMLALCAWENCPLVPARLMPIVKKNI